MQKTTEGKVLSVKTQTWFKVNTKNFRTSPTDGALFPHIVKVSYSVDGRQYTKRKWYGVTAQVPLEGSPVTIVYEEENPKKIQIIIP
ncbi:MAG: hypothetical protein K5634_05405 [Sphaerochaetaceae bacterium]|nr:hypothetical protein [Sphaerochaetaceae bacterium]